MAQPLVRTGMCVNELSSLGARLDTTASDVKQALNIVDVVGEYVRLEPKGPVFRGLCPFHDDSNPSLFVNPEYQTYRCWSCGAKGDVFSFVQEIERISFVEALQRLADNAGITPSQRQYRS